MIACLGIYYVWVLNQNATKGYNIRTLQVQNRELFFQANLLDIRIAEGQSIGTIMDAPLMARMENVEQPTFLVMKDAAVSMNE